MGEQVRCVGGDVAQAAHAEIRQEVHHVLENAADRHIIGADCTVPRDTDWENLRTAITEAHEYEG